MTRNHTFARLAFSFSFCLLAPIVTAACSSGDSTPEDGDSTHGDSQESDLKAGKKKKKNSCASIFGECVGLSPSSCVGGTWADANQFSCGSGIGVGCCVKPTLPPPPPPPAPSCPTLSPPAPGSCVGGQLVPKHDAFDCIIGYDCIDPLPPACVQKGGTCVGLSPSSCPSGHWGDAKDYYCGPGLGVGCCLP